MPRARSSTRATPCRRAWLNSDRRIRSDRAATEPSPKPVPVVINVNKLKQTITWKPRKKLTLDMKLGEGS